MVQSDDEAIAWAQHYFSYVADHYRVHPHHYEAMPPDPEVDIASVLPADAKDVYDMHDFIRGLVDEHSFFPIKDRFARELITGFARLDGQPIGIVASQPAHLGGVLFVDSADKAARFMWLCDAFNIPLLFLADVPGFMIGSQVEAQGIIRHGAKMLTAMAEATVPRISVVVRKAYGAGLYAFSGPGLRPEATIALPTAEIAVMGPEAAVNAVYFNKIEALEGDEREAFVAEKRAEYEEDVDLLRLAAEGVIDAVIEPADLREELIGRYAIAANKDRRFSERRHGVPPV
jgi:acetyl-CoA carboxylase carboxyltransferase component